MSIARARVLALADAGSFVELGSEGRHRLTAFDLANKRPLGDGVVTGVASLDGRPIAVYAQDPGVLGGSLGEIHAGKIARILLHALRARIPVVGLIDSGGARIQEGVAALDGYAAIFRANVALSGRAPQISVILGPCAGGAVYSPALTDFVIMERSRAHMFITGPKVVRSVTFEDVSLSDLGGADVHAKSSGVASLVADGESGTFAAVRSLIAYLPSSCWSSSPRHEPVRAEAMIEVPTDQREPYDVRGVVRGVVDAESFLELQPSFAANIVVGLARLEGRTVGVVANQPSVLAGCLDVNASEKAARFVRFCDAFDIPIITLVDTPGYLPGRIQESSGIIRRGAKLLHAYTLATVPRVTVALRKAFGGAYIVMGSKALGADASFAWPTSQIGVMGAEAAVEVIHHKDLAENPGRRAELVERYEREAMAAHVPAERLSVDEIIPPARPVRPWRASCDRSTGRAPPDSATTTCRRKSVRTGVPAPSPSARSPRTCAPAPAIP